MESGTASRREEGTATSTPKAMVCGKELSRCEGLERGRWAKAGQIRKSETQIGGGGQDLESHKYVLT